MDMVVWWCGGVWNYQDAKQAPCEDSLTASASAGARGESGRYTCTEGKYLPSSYLVLRRESCTTD
jgi:hypothetical protein